MTVESTADENVVRVIASGETFTVPWFYYSGFVADGSLYSVYDDTITALDLTTGESRSVANPPDVTDFSIHGTSAGFFAWSWVRDLLSRYDRATGAYTFLADDLDAVRLYAFDADRVGIVGAGVSYVFMVYDVAADRLLVSDDVCLEDTVPELVTPGRIWTVETDENDVLLSALRIR